MKYKTIILMICLMFCTISYAEDDVVSIAFINSNPGVTELGIVKFVIDENNEIIGYIILNIRWSDEKKVILLSPGLYGIIKHDTHLNKVVDHKMFLVEDEPFVVNM